jgi:hypothetical protein
MSFEEIMILLAPFLLVRPQLLLIIGVWLGLIFRIGKMKFASLLVATILLSGFGNDVVFEFCVGVM